MADATEIAIVVLTAAQKNKRNRNKYYDPLRLNNTVRGLFFIPALLKINRKKTNLLTDKAKNEQ